MHSEMPGKVNSYLLTRLFLIWPEADSQMKNLIWFLCFAVLLAGCGHVNLAVTVQPPPTPTVLPTPAGALMTRVVRTDSEINIDGLLNEPVWSEAAPLTYAIHSTESGSSTATVRFLWNNDYLFVGFDVNDTQVETADPSTPWDGDSVSILLDEGGTAEYRQSLGEERNDDKAYELKPLTTLNESADTDSGYTVEMRIKWQAAPQPGKRIPADLLSVDHDANPGSKYSDPATIFSKLSWDGDGDISSAKASLLLGER